MAGFSFFQRRDAEKPDEQPRVDQKLHTIAGLLRGRAFVGAFESGGATHEFTFAPSAVALAGKWFEMTGTLEVGPKVVPRASVGNVKATLLSTQGGVGRAPTVRRELLAQTAQGAKTGKADQLEKPQPGGSGAADATLPITEATGPKAYVGVMYLRLSPLDARALGVAADMSAVQLVARLAPESETERELQWLFSGLVAALGGERPDRRSASAHADAINRVLGERPPKDAES